MSYQYATRKQARPLRSADVGPKGNADPLAGGINQHLPSARRVDLPDAIKSKMENAFGADFSGVKLYESPAVDEAGDQAVAQGSNIAFAPGALNFSSRSGQELLGHELSHVVSQARGESRGSGLLENSSLEAKADREGAMAASGRSVDTASGALGMSMGAAAGMGMGLTASAPMQAKAKKRRGRKKKSAPAPKLEEALKKAAGGEAPAGGESAAGGENTESKASEPEKAPDADSANTDAGKTEGGENAAPPTQETKEKQTPEAAKDDGMEFTKGGKIGDMVGKGAGILGALGKGAGGILKSLGLEKAGGIVGGIGDILGSVGGFIGTISGLFGKKKKDPAAEGEKKEEKKGGFAGILDSISGALGIGKKDEGGGGGGGGIGDLIGGLFGKKKKE